MYVVKEALDCIIWVKTPEFLVPRLDSPLVADSLNEDTDLNSGVSWMKGGGHLRAASTNPTFLVSFDDGYAQQSAAKAKAARSGVQARHSFSLSV